LLYFQLIRDVRELVVADALEQANEHVVSTLSGGVRAELTRRRQAFLEVGDSQLETLPANRTLAAWLQMMHADTPPAWMLP
jgi:hypothetical protein